MLIGTLFVLDLRALSAAGSEACQGLTRLAESLKEQYINRNRGKTQLRLVQRWEKQNNFHLKITPTGQDPFAFENQISKCYIRTIFVVFTVALVMWLGDVSVLRQMLRHTFAFREMDSRGWLPLHRAAAQPVLEVLETVLARELALSDKMLMIWRDTKMFKLLSKQNFTVHTHISIHAVSTSNERLRYHAQSNILVLFVTFK